jgi:hypothetical protein
VSLEPPVRPYRCKEDDCDYPLGGRCSRLYLKPDSECDRLVRVRNAPSDLAVVSDEADTDAVAEPDPVPVDDTTAPWSGQHVRYGELEELTRRSLPRLIAILGPSDAGKTSFLASLFLQIANGQYDSLPYRFASSRTLLAFDRLVLRANQWDGKDDGQIADHTSSDSGSQFLHLGFRPFHRSELGQELQPRHVDVLLSDIAGELATSWSQKATGNAAATMAFVRHADAVLVLVDSVKLSGPGGRVYDGEIAGLLRRVASVVRSAAQRPRVSIVFSKIDRHPALAKAGAQRTVPFNEAPWHELLRAGAIRTAIQALKEQEISLAAFSVSAFPSRIADGQAVGVMLPFLDALTWADRAELLPRSRRPIGVETRPFWIYAAAPKVWE